MNHAEMLELKKGDQVLYAGTLDSLYNIENGHLLTRGESWMDDDHTVEFTYMNQAGSEKAHFFAAEDIKFKE